MYISAVIAAAGLSSRMHRFKPLLPLGTATVIQHTIDSLRAGGAGQIIVVTGFQGQLLEEHLRFSSVTLCRNAQYATTDMLTSIQLGLAQLTAEAERVFIMPGDIPLVSPDTLRAMCELDAPVVRPSCHGRGGHPILLNAEAVHTVQTWKGTDGLKGLLRSGKLESKFMETEDAAVLMGAASPQGYQKLLEYYDHWNMQRSGM